MVETWSNYMTTQKQDSSHPQHEHSSPQESTGAGLMMEEMDEATLPVIAAVLDRMMMAMVRVRRKSTVRRNCTFLTGIKRLQLQRLR
jgi:hypothetical protein